MKSISLHLLLVPLTIGLPADCKATLDGVPITCLVCFSRSAASMACMAAI